MPRSAPPAAEPAARSSGGRSVWIAPSVCVIRGDKAVGRARPLNALAGSMAAVAVTTIAVDVAITRRGVVCRRRLSPASADAAPPSLCPPRSRLLQRRGGGPRPRPRRGASAGQSSASALARCRSHHTASSVGTPPCSTVRLPARRSEPAGASSATRPSLGRVYSRNSDDAAADADEDAGALSSTSPKRR